MQKIPLGELIEIEKGKKAKQLSERPSKTSVRYLQIDDLRPCAKSKYCEPFQCPEVSDNDVVIAWDGANAGIVSCGLDGYIGSTLAVLRPDSSKLIAPFLSRFLESKLGYLQANRTGATVPHLDRDILDELHIVIPDISTQKTIVTFLDQANRLRCLRRYALEMSNSFLPALFIDMFGDPEKNPKGWDKCIIDDVVEFSQYGTSQKNNFKKIGYPVLGMGNLTYSGELDLSELSYVDLPREEYEQLRLQPDDIIFNRTNSTELVGKTAHWRLNMDAVVASYLIRIRLKPIMLSEFFSALLNTVYFKKIFCERCKKAVGQSNISPTLLKEFAIYVPPLKGQEKFANFVTHYDREKSIQRESLRQAEHIFQSLLHQAFGEN